MGIGGGTLGVPLPTACNYSPHRAVGTASVFGLLIAIPGSLAMLFAHTPANAPEGMIGMVNWPGFLCIVPLTKKKGEKKGRRIYFLSNLKEFSNSH
jgi:uncharacterized protein